MFFGHLKISTMGLSTRSNASGEDLMYFLDTCRQFFLHRTSSRIQWQRKLTHHVLRAGIESRFLHAEISRTGIKRVMFISLVFPLSIEPILTNRMKIVNYVICIVIIYIYHIDYCFIFLLLIDLIEYLVPII
jgi:hypothetical protein